jgi:hypothetical protein
LTNFLSEAIESALNCAELRPACLGGHATKKQRREILDCAAWSRDAIYVLVGHAASAVDAHLPKRKKRLTTPAITGAYAKSI